MLHQLRTIFLTLLPFHITGICSTWLNSIAKNGAAVVAAVGIPTIVNSKFSRCWRLRRILQNKAPEQFFDSESFIFHESFAKDLSEQILLEAGGVRILWGPPNSGKSTTLVKILNNLHEKGKISGVFIIEPPTVQTRLSNPPEKWFYSGLVDHFGEIVQPNEKISSLLPRFSGIFKPYVIVIDQAEKEGFDTYIKEWVINMAVESARTKAFVVLLVTGDPIQADVMQNLNGRQKITLVGADHGNVGYRWKEKEVDAWLRAYWRKKNPTDANCDGKNSNEKPTEGLSAVQDLRKVAILAGTPGFLSYNSEILCKIPTKELINRMLTQASYFDKQWKDGADLLDSFFR